MGEIEEYYSINNEYWPSAKLLQITPLGSYGDPLIYYREVT